MKAADSVEITTLVDNCVNGFLAGSEGVQRPRLDVVTGVKPGKPCLAEFEWAALIKIKAGEYILFFSILVLESKLFFTTHKSSK